MLARVLLPLVPALLAPSFQEPDAAVEVAVEEAPTEPVPAPFPVQVVERRSGKVVPGADLRYLLEENVGRYELANRGIEGQDIWAQVMHFGSTLEVDGDGRAVAPGWTAGRLTLIARGAPGYEIRRIREWSADGTTMKLRERGSRFVRLVDSAGTPLPDGWVAVRSGKGQIASDLTSAPIVAAQGGVELVHLERFQENVADGERLRLVQAGHFTDVPWIDFDPERLPDLGYELVGEPVGTVELRFVYEETGDPVPGMVEVEVVAEAGGSGSQPIRYLTQDGTLRIEQVGLNVPLSVFARRPGGEDALRMSVRGPAEVGGLVEVDGTFDEQDLLFFGRAIGVDGKPLYKNQLSVRLQARNVFGAQDFETFLVTEPDGGFFVLVPLQARIPVQSATLDLMLTDPDTGAVRSSASWSFAAEELESGELVGAMKKGAFDLGDLQMAEPGA